MAKITVIATILNEAKTIDALLSALVAQTLPPAEIILADGGSTDNTPRLIRAFADTHPQIPVRLLVAKGNRSVGRNATILAAKTELIAITDAGCIPHADWLEELAKAAPHTNVFCIAGYYDSHPQTPFQEAVVPYVLVMPERVNPNDFLPATRSMLITHSTWQLAGKFDEMLSDNEDYAFAHQLRAHRIPITFTAKAKVTWLPRTNLPSFAHMIFRFARGDARAHIWRPKVMLVFVRYLAAVGAGVLWISLLQELHFSFGQVFWGGIALWIIAILGYSAWAIRKNCRYAPHGWPWLPVLQFTADFMVMAGTIVGSL